MSVLDGPGEGTWSVFAQKVVEERDALREALRAAEKRELEALAELDEARAALQRVVEYDSDPDQSWSDLMSWCRGALLPREEREARRGVAGPEDER